MHPIEENIGLLYKEKFGQLITLIVRRFPVFSLDSAEDIVQEAFAQATTHWTKKGVPENPSGWLYQVCRNKAINLLKQKSLTADLSAAEGVAADVTEISENSFNDARLQMLITCCNPHLAPKTQAVLALKYVANFKVEDIALQLGLEMSAVEKMLYRARQKIKTDDLLSVSYSILLGKRLSVVHKVIYLIFHEGYKSPDRGRAICEDALILNKSLLDSPAANAETRALQSLMLFNVARFDTRFDDAGKVIELEHQDRLRWNGDLIRLAHQLLVESESIAFSQYHLEAAISFVHCAAKKFEETNWVAICQYYKTLIEIYPSPFAEINYAVALQYNNQNEMALRILTELHQNPWFRNLPILQTSIQKFHKRMGTGGTAL